MTAGDYVADVTITLESPFMSEGLAAQAFGVDAAQLMDARNRAVLPAGLVRGVVRHALAEMKGRVIGADLALALFGEEGNHDENAGRIAFRDCVSAPVDERRRPISTRIAIDDTTGAVEGGMIAVAQLSHPIGAEVAFKGQVHFPAISADEADGIAVMLDTGIRRVVALGAWKTAGFGRVVSASIGGHRRLRGIAPSPSAPRSGDAFMWHFALDGPLLVDTEYPEGNILRGATRIPGTALKGALAARLSRAGMHNHHGMISGPFGEALSTMIVGFADVGQAAAPQPLSILQRPTDNGCVQCDASSDGIGVSDLVITDRKGRPRIAAFAGDWKERDWRAGQKPVQPAIPMETRTRLAVSAGSGAAEDGKLFSHTFVPEPDAGGPGYWSARIVWPEEAGPPPPEFYDILGHLQDGVFPLGRLKAGTRDAALVPFSPMRAHRARQVALILDTPHRMIRARDMKSEYALTKAVDRYIATASNGVLGLARDAQGAARMYARQGIRGAFQAARFAPFGADRIEPFILMEAGSVFVLDVEGMAAQGVLDCWLREGLPDLDPALGYREGPFLRVNGYGAIRIAVPGSLRLPSLPWTEQVS